jgi:proteic killer suppression protein
LDIVFNNSKLHQLYETGSSRKYKLEPRIIEEFMETVNILEAAKDIHDLWKFPGFNFEKLGGFSNRYSVRLSRKYRLEMCIDWTNDQHTVGIIGLEELSNHYGGG